MKPMTYQGRQTFMFVSLRTYRELEGKAAFFFTLEGGSRRFKLVMAPEPMASDGVGYVVYRGQYVKAVNLKRFL